MSFLENDFFNDNLLSSHVLWDDIWKKLDSLPTPPVSPFRAAAETRDEEDLDLGIPEDVLDSHMPDLLNHNDWFDFLDEFPACCSPKYESGELRHDCMWAGRCPSEEHKKERDSPLFSTSPGELSFFASAATTESVRRPRFDTLGSTRPESPLPLSDSEPESADEEEEEEEEEEDADREPQTARDVTRRDIPSQVNIADHNYTHSDHSYHSQRKPPHTTEHLGIQTPSDSEEEIDVVSLGDVLVASSASTKATSSSAAAYYKAVRQDNNSMKLQLKVTQLPSAASKSSLPSRPTALVSKQLQMQLAAAASASHRKQQATSSSSSASSSRKRAARSDTRGASSPKKRSSRSASDSEDSCEKRSLHNNMERQRRVDLRNAFENLRLLIPDLESTDRAAKVVILKEASRYCQNLTRFERKLRGDKDNLMQRQQMLQQKLSSLQRRR